MFDYFDSMSVFMKLIRLGRIVIHKSELDSVLIVAKESFCLHGIIFEPLRLYLYVPP